MRVHVGELHASIIIASASCSCAASCEVSRCKNPPRLLSRTSKYLHNVHPYPRSYPATVDHEISPRCHLSASNPISGKTWLRSSQGQTQRRCALAKRSRLPSWRSELLGANNPPISTDILMGAFRYSGVVLPHWFCQTWLGFASDQERARAAGRTTCGN